MSSHEIVGIDVAARKLVVIGERLALAEYENTAAGRSKLVNALSGARGRCGSCWKRPGCTSSIWPASWRRRGSR